MKKFYAVIGNPPYQEESVGDQKTYTPPIYHLFMDSSFEVGEKVELITPARFLFDAGSTPKSWNKKMLEDTHFKVVRYEADCSMFFPGTDIKGGIAITYRDKTRDYEPVGHLIVFDELSSIVSKIKKLNELSLNSIIYAAETYKFTDALHDENPEIERFLSKGHKYDLKTSVFKSLTNQVFFQDKPNDGEYVEIIGLENANRTWRWIKKEYISGPNNFESYKVILPAANGSGALGEVLSTPLIGQPLIGHTQTFISIGKFDKESEANACMKYIKSKFARVLLGVLKITQHNPGPKWRFVPLQDFTASSDIDWTKSVPEIDQQLYVKYVLSDEEIAFIESHVKEMN